MIFHYCLLLRPLRWADWGESDFTELGGKSRHNINFLPNYHSNRPEFSLLGLMAKVI